MTSPTGTAPMTAPKELRKLAMDLQYEFGWRDYLKVATALRNAAAEIERLNAMIARQP